MATKTPPAPLTVPVRNLKAETVGEATLPAEIFGVPFRRHLVWEAVKEIRAREHRGTHKTKTRSEVSGSGKKPFKQKHTGRARQGGGRPPIHRHGGTVHGPTPHAYDLKVNVATKKAALRCVLSEKLRENQLVLLESLELPTHRTADLAAANTPDLSVRDALALIVYDALRHRTVVLTEHALKTVTEVLS